MNNIWRQIEKKVCKDWEDASAKMSSWKSASDKVVFTNGCFDLLHLGHLQYLSEAADLGQKLIIGLNSDLSVQRLKGKNRPIKKQNERARQLASLSFVDAVVIFEEDTPEKLIKFLLPDILVKGGDYSIDQIVGAEAILSAGGSVKNLSFLDGYSSTNLIRKIQEL